MFQVYDTQVAKRFTIYNSLFLDLPFDDIYVTGTLLPFLGKACEKGYAAGKSPREIIDNFFEEMMPEEKGKAQTDFLFQMRRESEMNCSPT
jgi:phosphoenolpyruvate carboxylase